MQTKYKNKAWEITVCKTEMEKLDSLMGWLMPLTELSTPVKEHAEVAMGRLEIIKEYLEGNAVPMTEET